MSKKKLCNPKCIYFPTHYSDVLEEWTNEYGIKERRAVFLCDYDDHRIIKWESCKYYKDFKEIK